MRPFFRIQVSFRIISRLRLKKIFDIYHYPIFWYVLLFGNTAEYENSYNYCTEKLNTWFLKESINFIVK